MGQEDQWWGSRTRLVRHFFQKDQEGGQDLFPSPIYLEPSSPEEIDKAWFTVVASLSSMKPASDDESQGKEEKGRNKGESRTPHPPAPFASLTHTCMSPVFIVGGFV